MFNWIYKLLLFAIICSVFAEKEPESTDEPVEGSSPDEEKSSPEEKPEPEPEPEASPKETEEDNEDAKEPEPTVAPPPEAVSSTGDVSSAVLEATESVTEKKVDEEAPKMIPTTEMPSEPTEFGTEKAPESTFAVRNARGKICLLARLNAQFKIHYLSKRGNQSVSVSIPDNAVSKGRCGNSSHSPILHLSWEDFGYILTFTKFSIDESADEWAVTGLELKYDTGSQLFDEATTVGSKVARREDVELFRTECGRSYSCPTSELVHLHGPNGKKVGTVRMENIELQPFDVEDGKFSKPKRCNEVVIGGPKEPFVQDETAPLAVGLTLTIITLVLLLGYSIRRSYLMKKVDYNNMEE